MTPDSKDKIQYFTAVAMILSGIVLSFLCFFLNHYSIDDSVLWYLAQALVYAGSIFGVSMYIHTKFGEVKNEIKDILKDKENERSN